MKAPRPSGFTMVELVAIILIVGILAAIATPRFFNTDVFEARGYYDYVAATLRYAHKTAIAQRRVVYVKLDIGTGQVSLCFTNSFPCSVAADQVPKPTGEKPYVVTPPSGVTLSLSPAPTAGTFFFDSLGRPYDSADAVPASENATSSFSTLTVTVTGGEATRTIVVERESGYART